MFTELVGSLRCVNEHQDTYLVAASQQMSGQEMLRGVLGCPVCFAEYEVRDGIARFGEPPSGVRGVAVAANEYEALRGAALLNLQGHGGHAVLCGEWGVVAPLMLDSTGIHLVLINPPASVRAQQGLSILATDGRIPLALQSVRGIALDTLQDDAQMARTAALVQSGGRLVAPVGAGLPANARLLASDERHWVAEVSHPAITSIGRRS